MNIYSDQLNIIMGHTEHIFDNHWKTLIEGSEEYYGYSMTKEKAAEMYETACLDANCEQTIDIDMVKSGDVLYVSEEDDSDIYTVQIQ